MQRHVASVDLPPGSLHGLEVEDGALGLIRLPPDRPEGLVSLAPDPAFSGAAGLVADRSGHLYIADPAGHRVLRRDACSQSIRALAALSGPGAAATELRRPRGLALDDVHLYVADSGNHRIHVLDARTLHALAIWGTAEGAPPSPSVAVGRLDDPWDLAVDRSGHLYVVDHGNRRVQRFRRSGDVVPGFWETVVATGPVPSEPTHVTVALIAGDERVLVADGASGRIHAYGTDGRPDAVTFERWAAATVGRPGGVRFDGGRLYLADAATGVLSAWDANGRSLGTAASQGPLSGLGLDGQGGLLLHPGTGAQAMRLRLDAGRARDGWVVVGPIQTSDERVDWHQVALRATLPEGAHGQLFTCTTRGTAPPVLPAPPFEVLPDTLTPVGAWRPVPRDLPEALVLNEPASTLWVGMALSGDGRATPSVRGLRIDYDHPSWLRHLPAIYRHDPDRPEPGSSTPGPGPVFLRRMLALLETQFDQDRRRIDELPRLFDPATAPDAPPEGWLDWLAGWLDVSLDEAWPEEQRRRVVQEAMGLHAIRGTAEGLRRAVATLTGLTVHVEEHGPLTAPWSLGHVSTLGLTTVLAGTEAQGAVVGTTATLGQSHLTGNDEHGAAVFDEAAHGICVQAYAADLTADQRARLERVVRSETPAHTVAHVCAIAARSRVGMQARVGIDAILGESPDLVLSRPRRLGVDTVLAAPPLLAVQPED